jgi:hypothetical protein
MTIDMPTDEAPPSVPEVVLGRRTRLRALRMADYAWLYETLTDMDAVGRWRFRGAPPEPEHFPDVLWLGVQTQLVVESLQGEPIGLVTSYGADLRSGYTKVACVFRPEFQQRGWPFEGVLRFVDHLLTHWPFRKIYFEAPAPVANDAGLATVARDLLVREACLTDHDLFDGRHVDLVIYALTRDRFYARFGAVLDRPVEVSA